MFMFLEQMMNEAIHIKEGHTDYFYCKTGNNVCQLLKNEQAYEIYIEQAGEIEQDLWRV